MRLDTVKGLLEIQKKYFQSFWANNEFVQDGILYCPTCGENRRMEVVRLYPSNREGLLYIKENKIDENLLENFREQLGIYHQLHRMWCRSLPE